MLGLEKVLGAFKSTLFLLCPSTFSSDFTLVLSLYPRILFFPFLFCHCPFGQHWLLFPPVFLVMVLADLSSCLCASLLSDAIGRSLAPVVGIRLVFNLHSMGKDCSQPFHRSGPLLALRSLWDLKHMRKAEGDSQEVITNVAGKNPFPPHGKQILVAMKSYTWAKLVRFFFSWHVASA